MKQNNAFRKLFFILAIILCLAASAFGFDLEKKVVKAKFKNGLTVLMLERHLSPTVSLYIRHRVGSVDEADGESGGARLSVTSKYIDKTKTAVLILGDSKNFNEPLTKFGHPILITPEK